ncbi:hypothetical protein [Actinomyces qiguomingii]|uniref:hypothetical protein n=1 Tax=Actinomyces qiguomingii TaxID=2057800 RepID=UPI000CA053E5|nr:hypothetical protein [Actinomyces qiguomingii]
MALSDREYRKAFYQALNIQQGRSMSEEDEYERFYVPIYASPNGPAGPDLVAEIINAIDFTTGGSVQLLSGYRGAGKTTELMRLRRKLDPERYVPVYWDVEDYFNTELPIDEGTFLVGLAAGFVDNCEDAGLPQDKLRERLWDFLGRMNVNMEASAGPISAGWGQDGAIHTQVGVGPVALGLRATLRDDESFRAQVRKALESNRAVFRKEIHQFFTDVVADLPGERTPVFIVDSIDHYRGRADTFDQVRESVESLFSVYADELALPGMHVVYTVPIHANPPGWRGQRWPVLNVKVRERDGSDCAEGIELLREVLSRRAPERNLERLLGDQVDRVIRDSGGLFRDLFRLVAGLLLKEGALPVDVVEIESAENRERSNLDVGLSEEHLEILVDVQRTKYLRVPRERSALAWELQARGAMMCYRNGTVNWYGVHPLLEPLVADMNEQS